MIVLWLNACFASLFGFMCLGGGFTSFGWCFVCLLSFLYVSLWLFRSSFGCFTSLWLFSRLFVVVSCLLVNVLCVFVVSLRLSVGYVWNSYGCFLSVCGCFASLGSVFCFLSIFVFVFCLLVVLCFCCCLFCLFQWDFTGAAQVALWPLGNLGLCH